MQKGKGRLDGSGPGRPGPGTAMVRRNGKTARAARAKKNGRDDRPGRGRVGDG
ncbi:MAG: hypothetical protein HSCHL_0803 [Hydrogenibacillus schlegelii]|uniref:Uncharacterized protein n=1 Tax=Hydrogenibacillus schlegelii TaxID=1484 RepID=A0A2T5GD93_HYDSH|nr:MAG: hypothetical protein HSCHL_0803 [Hydrogenibacillus schlegelii]